MRIIFSSQSWEEDLFWQKTDRRVLRRINTLIREICREPYRGLGKPEPLRHALAGYWSRRIDDEHRLVYKVEGDSVYVAQVRYHY